MNVNRLYSVTLTESLMETLSRDWRSSNFVEERENINSIETIRWIVRRRIDRFSLIRESEPCARTQKADCKGLSTRMIDAGSKGTGEFYDLPSGFLIDRAARTRPERILRYTCYKRGIPLP